MIGEKGADMILLDAQQVAVKEDLLADLNTLKLSQRERVKLKKDDNLKTKKWKISKCLDRINLSLCLATFGGSTMGC